MEQMMLKLDQIVTGENIRKDITKESLAPLIESIKELGILQPVVVEKKDGKYHLAIGYRRYNACKIAGVAEIPAVVMDIENGDRTEYQLAENLQRKDLNPIDEALAYKDLLEKYDTKDLVVMSGKSDYHIKKIIALLGLCKEVQDLIKAGELSADHGYVISRLDAPEMQKALAKEIKRYRYSPIQAEGELKNFSVRLEQAQFDKKDCAECSFNGSKLKDLFSKDNSLSGQCLNKTCYFKKVGEVQQKKAEEYKKAGINVKIIKTESQYGSKEYEEVKDLVDFSGYAAEGFSKEQFTTECSVTCKSFMHIIGPTGVDKPVCANPDCFKRSLSKAKRVDSKAKAAKTGDPEKDASIEYEVRQKANRVDLFKRNYYINGLPKEFKDVQLTRIILHQLILQENGATETISELLGLKKQPNYMVRGLKNVNELKKDKMESIIKSMVLGRLSQYTTEELEALGVEAGLNIGKEFVITKEYLDKYSKSGLEKLAKELKIKVGTLVWKEKKDEIIKILLSSGIKGKVPKEMIK